ncbi:MAG: hypothetical protein U9N62_07345 [Thermotogota bacterium]|nr:hypothetical protein [Thermotogota bacterium]
MKKAIILVAIMAIIIAGATFGQIRLGITAQDTYNGVMISAVHYGYPASGILRNGDIVRYAKVIYNSQPVMMSGNLMVMGMDQKVIVNLSAYPNGYGQYVTSSGQLQSIVFGAPYNSTVVLTVQRNGYMRTYAIALLNNGGFRTFMAH